MDFSYAQIMADNIHHEIVPSHCIKQVGRIPTYDIIRRSKSCENLTGSVRIHPFPWVDIIGMTFGIVSIFGGLFMLLE